MFIYWILLIHAGPTGPPPSPPPKRSGRAMAALQASDLRLRQQIPYSDIESYDIICIWSWYVRNYSTNLIPYDDVCIIMHLCIHLLILMQLVPSGTPQNPSHPLWTTRPIPWCSLASRSRTAGHLEEAESPEIETKNATLQKYGDFMIEV